MNMASMAAMKVFIILLQVGFEGRRLYPDPGGEFKRGEDMDPTP